MKKRIISQESKYACNKCKHFRGRWVGTCKAFPKGIPIEIASGEVSHRNAYKGDKGIVFKPIP